MIQDYIHSTFGILYTLSGISKLMATLGLKWLRAKTIPGKSPSLEDQVQFILRYHQTKACAQNDEGLVQLFGDGMHLHHQVVPSFCWGDPLDPPLLNTNSHRQRLNILGAYSLEDQQLIHLTSEKNCDGQRVIEFFEKLLQAYPQKHTIVLYLDNAPYFYAPLVREWLEQHPQLVIESLPTYSPNLNLIERLWRLVKGKLVKNRYYEKYKTFRAHVFRVLNHMEQYVDELKTLITENFQLIGQF